MLTFVAQQPNSGLGRPVSRFPSHTITHIHTHTQGRTPLNEWSARRTDRYLHNTQQTQQANSHTPIYQGAADLRLRPQGHTDRMVDVLNTQNFQSASIKTNAKMALYCGCNGLKSHPGERPFLLNFFCKFFESLQANSRTVPHIKLKPIPSMSSPVNYYSSS